MTLKVTSWLKRYETISLVEFEEMSTMERYQLKDVWKPYVFFLLLSQKVPLRKSAELVKLSSKFLAIKYYPFKKHNQHIRIQSIKAMEHVIVTKTNIHTWSNGALPTSPKIVWWETLINKVLRQHKIMLMRGVGRSSMTTINLIIFVPMNWNLNPTLSMCFLSFVASFYNTPF